MGRERRDIIEDSWVYQEWKREGLKSFKETLDEVPKKDLKKWQAKTREYQFQAIMSIVKQRFPTLETLALQKITPIADVLVLNVLFVGIFSEYKEEAVRKLLMDGAKK